MNAWNDWPNFAFEGHRITEHDVCAHRDTLDCHCEKTPAPIPTKNRRVDNADDAEQKRSNQANYFRVEVLTRFLPLLVD